MLLITHRSEGLGEVDEVVTLRRGSLAGFPIRRCIGCARITQMIRSSLPWPIRSVIAGAAGTAAMSLAYGAERRLRPSVKGPLDYDDSLVPGKIVANVLHLPAVTAREKHELGEMLRWGYGSAFGLWHGLLRRLVGEPWASLAFGGTLMTATFAMFPLLGRTPPPWRWPADVLATSVGTHVVYVTAVALTDAALATRES